MRRRVFLDGHARRNSHALARASSSSLATEQRAFVSFCGRACTSRPRVVGDLRQRTCTRLSLAARTASGFYRAACTASRACPPRRRARADVACTPGAASLHCSAWKDASATRRMPRFRKTTEALSSNPTRSGFGDTCVDVQSARPKWSRWSMFFFPFFLGLVRDRVPECLKNVGEKRGRIRKKKWASSPRR